MSLMKQFTEKENIMRSESLVIKNAVFPRGFISFLDSLVRDGIVAENYSRTEGAIGHRWNDTRVAGGLLIETDQFPFQGRVGVVLFDGVPEAIELVERMLKIHQVEFKK